MEQRQHPRFPVQFHSSFSSINRVAGDGNLGDLSIRGCRVFSPTGVTVGTALELRIEVGDDEPAVQVQQALVRWVKTGVFGVEFMSLTPDEWARLQHVVKELERQPYQRETLAEGRTG
jgi:hypothetical protein